MTKLVKVGTRFLLVILLLLMILVTISLIYHKSRLAKEEFVPIGQTVEVNGHHIHVYQEGSGSETLVFMAGGGTSAPVLDFKSLYSLLSDEYRIVVIEKAGYGFSDVTNSDRDIETILKETRESLYKSGLRGPYILVPHSMSGLEALYWAQVYPDEVKAIVGLDIATPAVYEEYPINMPLIYAGRFLAEVGGTRWLNLEHSAITSGNLTEEEKELYRLIANRRTSTLNMVNEVKRVKANAQHVKELGLPSTPILLFSSNGEDTGMDPETWAKFHIDFVSDHRNTKHIKLNASHYLHNIEFEQIAKEIKLFINKLTL